jgi:hypothetical protein
VASN